MSENSQKPQRPELPEPPQDTSGYEYKKLAAVHESIIRFYVLQSLHGNPTQKEIAEEFGVTKQTVNNVLNSQLGKFKIQQLQEQLDVVVKEKMEKIHEVADYSIAVKEQLLLNPNTDDKLRNRIAEDFLDRAGAKEPEKHEVAHAHFTKEDMEEIRERAEKGMENAEKTGNVVEIEEEEG